MRAACASRRGFHLCPASTPAGIRQAAGWDVGLGSAPAAPRTKVDLGRGGGGPGGEGGGAGGAGHGPRRLAPARPGQCGRPRPGRPWRREARAEVGLTGAGGCCTWPCDGARGTSARATCNRRGQNVVAGASDEAIRCALELYNYLACAPSRILGTSLGRTSKLRERGGGGETAVACLLHACCLHAACHYRRGAAAAKPLLPACCMLAACMLLATTGEGRTGVISCSP
jgi:hypothetical protein